MAWKTKDADDIYSESQWIFTMIVVQMEVILVAVPTITILRDVSTDGRYLGFMFLVLAFPMSALAFVMAPKVFSYYEAIDQRNAMQNRQASVVTPKVLSGYRAYLQVRTQSIATWESRLLSAGIP
jgi:hypothetical protein